MTLAITQDDRELAQALMTAKEFEAWFLVDALGWSTYQAAAHLNLSRATIRDRLRSSRSKWLKRTARATTTPSRRTNEIAINLLAQRDGPWCYLCGAHSSTTRLEIEHIIPTAHGGTNEATNIRLACAPCNLRKGSQAVAFLIDIRRPVYYPIS